MASGSVLAWGKGKEDPINRQSGFKGLLNYELAENLTFTFLVEAFVF